MDQDALSILLDRIEQTASSMTAWNLFEIKKTSRNLDYAQKLLIRLEIDGEVRNATSSRQKIRRLQEVLAEQEDLLDRLDVSDSESEPDFNQLPPDVSDANPQQKFLNGLSTQEHILQNHRETQESISDDLLSMAQTLRQNQVKFGESILKDNALIEKTAEALQINEVKMKATGGRLSEYSRKSSSMCWLSVGAVLVAFVAFFIMIGVIRVT